MNEKAAQREHPSISPDDLARRKREGIIIVIVLGVVTLLTFVQTRVINFGDDVLVSNTILMFILINLNLLLVILLIFLVFRNLVKLLYDRKRKVMGAKLRTKLVVAFIIFTLSPTLVLFFFSINFITTSFEFWFNVPVEQALENSLNVGRQFYQRAEQNGQFYLEQIAYQIKNKKLLKNKKKKELSRYIRIAQRSFNLDALEVYSTNSKRLTFALAQRLENRPLGVISADIFQKGIELNKFQPLAENFPTGELFRIINTIPFGINVKDAEAYLVLSYFIPPTLSRDMASISKGFEEYQQIKLLREPIQITYYITLSIVALLVVFCAVWFGFYLAKSISVPIMDLAEGTRRVADGNLNFKIDPVSDDEMGSLVSSFNKMTDDLRVGREQLELSTRMLQQQNIEIEERRQYMEIVLRNVSAGVITLDANGAISTINRSAEKMLNLKADQVLNVSYKKVLKGHYAELAKEMMQALDAAQDDVLVSPLRLVVEGRPRSFMVHINKLKDESEHPMGIVMVFDDLTDLEKAQRMVAWREVARRIAHEVKNPLTPISLSAQRIKRKYSTQLDDPIFDECTGMIIDHVELIRNLVNEFSTFARFPAANPTHSELPVIIEETVALYREGHTNISFDVSIAEDIPKLSLDRQQIKQAFINLIDNAVAALTGQGDIAITTTHDPILKMVRIEIADNGEGISDEDKTRLFEPNFSTKKTGMGLGLTIVNTIITDHNGMISVQDNQPRGAKFVIELPV
jgi:two-component system nitrogen regulation sensor histidine kinase NtrY